MERIFSFSTLLSSRSGLISAARVKFSCRVTLDFSFTAVRSARGPSRVDLTISVLMKWG